MMSFRQKSRGAGQGNGTVGQQRKRGRGDVSVEPLEEDQIDEACACIIRSLKRRPSKHRKGNATVLACLQSCSASTPCGSGACLRCTEPIWRQIKEALARHLNASRRQGQIPVMLTVITASGQMPVGQLRKLDAGNFKRQIKCLLRKLGFKWCVGALDFSVSEHEVKRYPAQWTVHVHAFSAVPSSILTRRRPTRGLRTTDSILRPVKVQSWDGNIRAVDYAYKTTFERRTATSKVTHVRRKKPWQKASPWPKSGRLRAAERHELLRFLHKSGLKGRLFQFGAAFRGGSIHHLGHARFRKAETAL
jgi:hypothetical protein